MITKKVPKLPKIKFSRKLLNAFRSVWFANPRPSPAPTRRSCTTTSSSTSSATRRQRARSRPRCTSSSASTSAPGRSSKTSSPSCPERNLGLAGIRTSQRSRWATSTLRTRTLRPRGPSGREWCKPSWRLTKRGDDFWRSWGSYGQWSFGTHSTENNYSPNSRIWDKWVVSHRWLFSN